MDVVLPFIILVIVPVLGAIIPSVLQATVILLPIIHLSHSVVIFCVILPIVFWLIATLLIVFLPSITL